MTISQHPISMSLGSDALDIARAEAEPESAWADGESGLSLETTVKIDRWHLAEPAAVADPASDGFQGRFHWILQGLVRVLDLVGQVSDVVPAFGADEFVHAQSVADGRGSKTRCSCYPPSQPGGASPLTESGASSELGPSATRHLTSPDRRMGGAHSELGGTATPPPGGASPVKPSCTRTCAYKALTGNAATPATQSER